MEAYDTCMIFSRTGFLLKMHTLTLSPHLYLLHSTWVSIYSIMKREGVIGIVVLFVDYGTMLSAFQFLTR